MTEYRVHTYTAAEAGLFVNSYLVESAEGVVLVDASLLLSDARALAARLEALHKPLLGVFVTHAHPDHFNGLPTVAGDDVPVYATAAVADTIDRIAEPKRAQWQPVYGAEWPDKHRVPDRRLSDGDLVQLGGLRFEVHQVGAAESHADSYLVLDDQAFIGDLAFHRVHPYTADGHTGDWLAALDHLEAELAGRTLLPGHGAPGDAGMLADQRRYLMMYREVVARLAGGAPRLTDAQREELTATMCRFLPGAPLTWMIGLGADAVAAELAA
ncbi:glyoxylase-like metal-dependent hydrolase (beta-lactamase superfamily II) [Actinoplanes octamycinicus]|uniref:Glyoxylase-like metal-dependent hydrolase (Beta-lactamase superfamily II) n=1 Tax=Actinoplanes octamycinicus TaxID=135948 RepID=A0A7W7H099_9ACTN|nr:MBL fold metallo-hydrolase [Actinoplanes octamycinicus]MBB4741605.1 glyoxylase-like metal-dependent hydrolase (beta-lactamase superfamily II) [Actinoplanes octamycinicus]GIE57157.1 MBL fold metallo-hydrolase [Actinoplanes octamycinicus]